jgi:DNA-binding transcriptional MocR family regulator
VVQRALAAGVRVYPLADFRTGRRAADTPGLVIEYGALPPRKAERGIRLLANAIADLPR